MNDSFLFLTTAPKSKSGEVHTPLINVDRETLDVEMPTLAKELKEVEGLNFDNFKTFSVLSLQSLPVTDSDFAKLKPCLFKTIFVDTYSAKIAWEFEADYSRARSTKNGALRGFTTTPNIRFWV
jgi:hypothetical protein